MIDPGWSEGMGDDGPSAEDLARVRAEVAPDERLLWVGKPGRDPGSRGGSIVAFGLILLLGAVGMRWFAASEDPAVGDPTWLFLGALVALELACFLAIGLMIYALVRRANRARRRITLYALTDRRAIIWRPAGRPGGVEVAMFRRGGVHEVRRVEFPDGSGDLRLYPTADSGAMTVFARVPAIVAVERLARQALLE